MRYVGIHVFIYFIVLGMVACHYRKIISPVTKSKTAISNEDHMANNGNLYDVLKNRLIQFYSDLDFDPNTLMQSKNIDNEFFNQKRTADTKIPPEDIAKKAHTNQSKMSAPNVGTTDRLSLKLLNQKAGNENDKIFLNGKIAKKKAAKYITKQEQMTHLKAAVPAVEANTAVSNILQTGNIREDRQDYSSEFLNNRDSASTKIRKDAITYQPTNQLQNNFPDAYGSIELKQDTQNTLEDDGKRSSVKEKLNEEYKKRLDKIHNEISMDGERVFDRSGRNDEIGSIKNYFQKQKQKWDNMNSIIHLRNNKVKVATYLTTGNDKSSRRNKRVKMDNIGLQNSIRTPINKRMPQPLQNSSKRDIGHNDAYLRIDNPPDAYNAINNYQNDINSLSYPSVLSKAMEASFTPYTGVPHTNILDAVAQKMNTTTMNLAKKLANVNDLGMEAIKNDPTLNRIVQKYIMDSVTRNKQREATPIPESCMPNDCESILGVLRKLVIKLEQMHAENQCTPLEVSNSPDGAPCSVIGSWNSYMIGLRFDISLPKGEKPLEKPLGHEDRQFATPKILQIAACEIFPPREHDIMDTDWIFISNAVKQFGGPIYIYAQKRNGREGATFIGFCRTCGSIDTIYGSWTFLTASRDCADMSTAIQTKRDMLRRYKLEEKTKERLKELKP